MNRAVFLLFAVVVAVHPLHAQEQLSTRSKKAIALYKEADNYRVRGQHQQAIQLLDEAIGRDKNFAEAYYRRGLVHFTRKNYDLAIATKCIGIISAKPTWQPATTRRQVKC